MILNKLYLLLSLITIILISQTIHHSRAADTSADKRGFTPPGRSVGSNPFRTSPTAPSSVSDSDDFDDEDFEDDDTTAVNDSALRNRIEQRLKEQQNIRPDKSPLPPPSIDFGQASNSVGASSTQNNTSQKLKPGEKGNACLTLDPYTGYGPDKVTNFDFPDADIVDIAKTLGRITCLNFILEKDVKGRISIVSNAPITVGDAWKAFLTALDINGYSLIPSGAYIRVAKHRDAKDKQIKTYTGHFSPDNDLYITRIMPLKYISAEEVVRVLRNMQGPNSRMFPYEQTNTIIITDTGANVKRFADIIELLDIEGFDESLEVIRIRFAAAQDIAKLIDQLLPGSAGGSPGAPPPPGGIPRFRGSGFAARKTKEGGAISHIIPDDRTNSVIVSANAKGLQQVKELINKLDAKVSASQAGSKINVIYLKFTDATEVAATLNSLSSGGGGPRATALPASGGAPTAQLFDGAVKISPDKTTNSLVITGNPSDLSTLKKIIARLDIQRDQVYVESFILEMTLDRNFDFGTSIANPTSGIFSLPNNDLANSLANPLALTGAVFGFQGGKGSKTFTVGDKSFTVSSIQGLIKAFQTNTNTNVLASPQILTLDNQPAEIEIYDNIPTPVTTQLNAGALQNSINNVKVTMKLKIKPSINKASNYVKLDIEQQFEDVSEKKPPAAIADSAFVTSGRSSKSSVVVHNGDTVAMGGLVRNKVAEVINKVPLLGDIPILGWLFRSKHTSTSKTNLLVFITPQIIKQYQDMRHILDKKVRQRDEFIDRNAGGDDPFQNEKMDMIQSLPPVASLKDEGSVDQSDIEPTDEPDTTQDSTPNASRSTPTTGNGVTSANTTTQTPPAATATSTTNQPTVPPAMLNPQTIDGATAPPPLIFNPPAINAAPAEPQPSTTGNGNP